MWWQFPAMHPTFDATGITHAGVGERREHDALERRFDHVEMWSDDGCHVESNLPRRHRVRTNPRDRQTSQSSLFGRRDCMSRRTVTTRRARLHLAHDEHGAARGDHVDFTESGATPIAIENRVTGRDVPLSHSILTPRAETRTMIGRRQPSCSRSSRGSSSTLTSLKLSTFTFGTKRLLRYMSHTHASTIST